MGPSQLNEEDIFLDEDPDLKQAKELFVDYNPNDLEKIESESLFTDTPPNAVMKKQMEVKEKSKSRFNEQGVPKHLEAPSISPDEYNAMSMWEKIDYAKKLEAESDFLSKKRLGAEFTSGSSFSGSEYVPGLETLPEEERTWVDTVANLAGSLLPIEGIATSLNFLGKQAYKAVPIKKVVDYVGKPLLELMQKSPVVNEAMLALKDLTGLGLTGATFEATKDIVKTGEIPSADEIAKHAKDWMILGAVFKSAGHYITKIMSDTGASGLKITNELIEQLKKENINPEVTPTAYAERAEKILKEKLPAESTNIKPETEAFLEKVKEPAVEIEGFTTEKGSTYTIGKEGKTTRNKAERPEHGPNEKGIQPESEKTWYVSKEDADKLGRFQAQGESAKKIEEYGDNLVVEYVEGHNKGKAINGTLATFKSEPSEGLIPIESWEGGKKIHFGNKITKISPKQAKLEIKRPKEELKLPNPIIETTGEGASKRHEYVKTKTDEIIETVNDFVEAAKTPGQSLKRLRESINTATFNFLAPLEKLEKNVPVAERVTSKIKLAQSVSSEINSVLENGIFSNITGNFEHGGLKDAYGDLTWKKITRDLKPEEYSIQEINDYRSSKIALKRQSEGKKTGIDTQKAKQDIARLKDKYEPIDKKIREFQQATISTYGKDLLGEDLVKTFNDNYYSPLYRVMDSGKDSMLKGGSLEPKHPFYKFEGSQRKIIPPHESDPFNASMLITNSRKNDAILSYMEKVQKGELPGKIRKGNQSKIPESIKKDLNLDADLDEVAENLYNQTRTEGFTPEKNTLRCWKNGKPIEIDVPEEIYDVFTTTNPQQKGMLANLFSTVNRLFSKGISMDPRKFVSIASRDALSSLIYSKTGSNPISVFEALADIYGNKEVYKQFKAMGGDTYAARLSTRIERSKKIDDLITPGREGIMVPLDNMASFFKKYPEALSDISVAVPLAEYKRALKVFGDTAEGRIAATMEAKRVTYDPTRKGGSKIVRGLGNYIPFFNVSLQDLSMIGENLGRKETWAKGFLAISAPTLALKHYNDGNPDYDSLNPWDKAAFWHIFSGDKHIRIPIPWNLGTVFKVGSEFFYDVVKNQAEEGNQRSKDAWDGLYHNFITNNTGSLPPLLQNYIEMSTGKSPASPLGLLFGVESKSPDVVPRRLQGLPPELQYTNKTSQLAKWFGDKWGISPVKLERSIKSYGGLVAADVLALTDEIAYATGLAEDKRPEKREKNYLLLGNFVSESTPSSTQYQTEFYEMLDQKTRQNQAKKIIPGYGDKSLDAADLMQYNKDISDRFKFMREIEDKRNISPAEKRRRLIEEQKKINKLFKQAVVKVRHARSKQKNR
jgi:hypothetical protein